MLRSSLFALITLALPVTAHAQCGGGFSNFVSSLKEEAMTGGYDRATVNRFFKGVRQDPAVLKADRAQGVFQKPFVEFSQRLISQGRLDRGRAMSKKYDAIFRRIETTYGIDRGVLLAFWAFETDYGAVQGNFNTLNALVTLAHDCRRPELFRPQVFAALELYSNGDFDPQKTTGAWAGEIGMVQMLPRDILENGVDADGDGHVRLKTSAPDALMSGAKMLSHLGWRPNEPWLQEVKIPTDLDLSQTGAYRKKSVAQWQKLGVAPRDGRLANPNMKAALLLPQGHKGPAFLAYPNFDVYFEWNQSFTYVLTAAYFGTRLSGADRYDAGNPDKGLSGNQMKQLQAKLQARGHDVGEIDGILGARTRQAVQQEQKRLGLPADAWPTPALLSRL
ncbi:lytic murein transglycosylase [Phaeobacter italicus]|uniref:lytic murein transglycosylase n=1 Tax=Phaeobacter italicus TaxID=481446 RepID=UPI000669BD23|nr:lytic murein transglycosylase [Phaeobacter italicus]CRL14890.1 Membrane-bound lytic murein transglycosylase B precursor [Phaeobacter italicus]SFH07703.1 lytic murein transglycosylase [Phaeobacter italicus]